jgi:hypothetical protein
MNDRQRRQRPFKGLDRCPLVSLPFVGLSFAQLYVPMSCSKLIAFRGLFAAAAILCLLAAPGYAEQSPGRPREFPPGSLKRIDQLPPGRLRSQIELLPDAAQQQALRWLSSLHFSERDLPSMRADAGGGIYFVCDMATDSVTNSAEPVTAAAAVPVSPFPAGLIFHSRPGAPNVIYLNFTGETVTGTAWNTSVGRDPIPAVAFSTDSDYTTFSDAEQLAIKRIWQRVSEDYAPFNVDVTTERPNSFNNHTANAVITRSTDANGAPNPSSTAGGVSYVNVFGSTAYATYRPSWVYINNLGPNEESYIAEATSHEVGHNMGLSHDGTSTTEYYGGNGSGDTSWGPIMGTGYNRNVSQWCKGDYYDANNTEDDLAIISGKLSYRTDDVGNSYSNATALVITGGTNIVSTTPDTDPANSNPANKGVIEQNTDVDVFSFYTGSGSVNLSVTPWVTPGGLTRGGNLDVSIELRDSAGAVLATNNPASLTTASIQTNLTAGQYFLYVKNTGVGDPFSSTPSGYTAYGSIGQYFINGYVVATVVPPQAQLAVTALTQTGQGAKQFSVTYTDNTAIDVSTIDSSDLRITGPHGYDRSAQFLSLSPAGNGTPRTATYAAPPPSGPVWTAADNGTYAVFMRSDQVADTQGGSVPAGQLGQFQVSVPVVLYSANLDADPGWTLDPNWQYGTPGYTNGTGPTNGFTGTNIIGYNLAGNYANNLATKYATTPPINCVGASTLTLHFHRWLGLRSGDTALIQASTNGLNWTNIWSATSNVLDSAWQDQQYTLPAGIAGSPTVRVRWGLASNGSQTGIGWNLDDIELLGDGGPDSTPPVPTLNVADVTTGVSASQPCTVTYTDNTAVRLASLNSNDLLVTGPNGYSNLAAFVSANLPLDGSPITASYAIAAPNGAWSPAANGVYQIVLLAGQVTDTSGNAIGQTNLGSFAVAIPAPAPGVLSVLPSAGFNDSGLVGGPFSPALQLFALTNSGGASLNWSVSKSQDWLSLSATSGSLLPGDSATVTVSLSASANNLSAGVYADSVTFSNLTAGAASVRPVSLTVNPLPTFTLSVAATPAAWGAVSPPGGAYSAGKNLQLLATPAPYFKFDSWTADISGTNNPVTVVLNANLSAIAVFAEILTTNHPTPQWWLAGYGYTNSFEAAVTGLGANGYPLWQSYIAGLDPTNATSQLLLAGAPAGNGSNFVLNWNTVTGRVYSLWESTKLATGFVPVPGATNLPWTLQRFTNSVNPGLGGSFYRLEVQKP